MNADHGTENIKNFLNLKWLLVLEEVEKLMSLQFANWASTETECLDKVK